MDANDVFLRMSGYKREQVHARQLTWRTMTPPEWISASEEQMKRFAATGRVGPYEKEYFCADGSRRWMMFSGRDLGDGTVVEYCVDVTDHKRAEKELMEVNRKLVAAQEEERARIGRELHDDISQQLAILAIELGELRQGLPDACTGQNGKLTEIEELLSEIVAAVQSISYQLHPPQLEYLGIVGAMKSFCTRFAARQKIEIDFRDDCVVEPVCREVALTLFRILQEALQNAAKYSGVRRFKVKLACGEHELRLTVSDRGIGFDPETVKKGLGLISMRERARLVNGTIEIKSRLMSGTTIDVHVPSVFEQDSARAVA